jgi:hypothetical protein
MKLIVMCNLPLSIVENEYFRKLCLDLNNKVTNVSRRLVTTSIVKKEIELKQHVKNILKNEMVSLS